VLICPSIAWLLDSSILFVLFVAALRSRCRHCIFVLLFLLLLFFPRLISAIADWMSTILLHMVWPYCEFRMQSQLRYVSTIGKKLVKKQYLLHMSPQYGELWPTNSWDWFGSLRHPSKFQRVSRLTFVTAATSRIGGQPNFALCLAVSCAGTLYIHFRGLFPWQNFAKCRIHFASKSCILVYWQRYCTALQQHSSTKLCGMVQGMELRNIHIGRHLCSAGQPTF